ncbi:hypothetical protein DVR12_20005 [Chitinophaga silvatica]|uniref:Uncharacterized protein n=1 Tax=Chitinophaga silvatica TaxID=2282649 RepID=A0A3E1Y5K8_9BACT|nr:hypothetical protein [Chitinophaga silvatica]RFS20011.1 hypothetical protein DVR12_20005 [Chitinophaga silvatica]
MKKYSAIFCVFLFVACTNQKPPKKCTDFPAIQPKSYAEVYSSIDSLTKGNIQAYLELSFTLSGNPGFRTMLNNPCIYKQGLITLLKDTCVSDTHRVFALYSLQHLCIDEYIEVLTTVQSLYENKKVDEEFMMKAIGQGFSLEVCKNYKNIHVQEILKSVMQTFKNKNRKNWINKILTGNSWKYSRSYYRESGEPMPWTCD